MFTLTYEKNVITKCTTEINVTLNVMASCKCKFKTMYVPRLKFGLYVIFLVKLTHQWWVILCKEIIKTLLSN